MWLATFLKSKSVQCKPETISLSVDLQWLVSQFSFETWFKGFLNFQITVEVEGKVILYSYKVFLFWLRGSCYNESSCCSLYPENFYTVSETSPRWDKVTAKTNSDILHIWKSERDISMQIIILKEDE